MHDDLALAFAALGHPDRIRIIDMVGEAGADGHQSGRIADSLGLPATTVSSQLKVLERAGILIARRSWVKGGRGRYTLNCDRLVQLADILRTVADAGERVTSVDPALVRDMHLLRD